MLLSLLAATVLAAPAAPVRPVEPGGHGKIEWFQGTYEAALSKAAEEDRLVFIDFWTDWCVWCKRLDADVFSQDTVAQAMSEIVCVSMDAESEAGAPVAKRFNVKAFPTLVLLNSDGSVRDMIAGYLPPEEFIAEIERIQADEGTISGLRRQVAAEPSNVAARFALATKLTDLGDTDGYAEQIAAIRKLDPEGNSVAMRTVRLQELSDQVEAMAKEGKYAQLDDLLAFLGQEAARGGGAEADTGLLFDGYQLAWQIEEFHTRLAAADDSEQAVVDDYARRELAMARKAWEHVPEDYRSGFGNQLAWHAWERRDTISDDYKGFALKVARGAAAAMKDNVNLLDTLACVLFMNGDREGALKQVHRCIELDPDNQAWTERLREFSAES